MLFMRKGTKELEEMKTRAGKFFVSDMFLITCPDIEEFKKQILSEVIIVRAEHSLMRDRIEYEGISNKFDKVEVGEMIPTYKIIGKDGKYEFERVDII